MPIIVLNSAWAMGGIEYVPAFVIALKAIALAAFILTSIIVGGQLLFRTFLHCKPLSSKSRICAGYSVRLIKQCILVPWMISAICNTALWLPYMSYTVDLFVAIGCLQVVTGSLYHELDVFADPPVTSALVASLPPKRWWCGPMCSGYSDPLCCLALCFGQAREEKPMTMKQMRIAYWMVGQWFWVLLIISLTTFYVNTFSLIAPAPMEISPYSGFCQASTSAGSPKKKTIETFVLALSILSGITGMSGYGVLVGATSLAKAGNDRELAEVFRQKSAGAAIYPSLPIWKGIISAIPSGSTNPMFEWMETASIGNSTMMRNTTLSSNHGVITYQGERTFNYFNCPIYDHEVMTHLIYCTVLAVFMLWAACTNKKQFPADKWDTGMRIELAPHLDSLDISEQTEEREEESGDSRAPEENTGETDDSRQYRA